MPNDHVSAPDAKLLISPGCTHCAAMLENLSTLVKKGTLGRLEIVNILNHPEAARKVGIRSVPWTRIGRFELDGAYTLVELTQWAKLAVQATGLTVYFNDMLDRGQLQPVNRLIRKHPDGLHDLIALLPKADTPISVRIGIGAVIEELQGSGTLDVIIPELETLTHSKEPNVRADACHYLGLTENPKVIPVVQHLLEDKNAEVREIARETLTILTGIGDK